LGRPIVAHGSVGSGSDNILNRYKIAHPLENPGRHVPDLPPQVLEINTGVIKRSNKYYYRIYRNGTQKEYGGFSTAEEAFNARNEHLNNIKKQNVEPSNILLQDFIIQYLKEYEIPNNRKTTAIKTEGICRNHIIPALGDKKLREIRHFHIVQFKNQLVKNKTESVAFNTMRTLRKILNKAVEWEFLDYSPLKTKLPSSPNIEHSVLPPEKLFMLIDELKGRDKCIVALAGFAALRRSEIFGLKWKDIDFKNNIIQIKRQNIDGDIVEILKNKQKKSIIPIWSRLSLMLKEWRLQSGSPEWLFKGRKGKPMVGAAWERHHWHEIKKEYNLPADFRFHDLRHNRHTFASILLARNAQPGDVQKLLRHSSIRTTMDIYRHILPGQLERNFEIFNSLYREKKP